MNMQRVLVLGVAAIAAGGAAFLARGLLGGGTAPVVAAPPQISTTEVLVASDNLQPGTALNATKVHWQRWPRGNVDSTFITVDQAPNLDAAVKGTVVRAPLLNGQPISNTAIVHADAASFMSASLSPGMRALSFAISTDTGAGGFILPNDRVDVVLTQKLSDNPPHYRASTILENVRVLAMDQTFKEDKDQKVVLAKTATVELTPDEAELLARSQATGTISLALRALGDSNPENSIAVASNSRMKPKSNGESADVTVIRYGVDHAAAGN